MSALAVVKAEESGLKLDLGCGQNKKEGFFGCDRISFPGVDSVFNIGTDAWPFDAESVEEAHASHVVEHLETYERVHFYNELYRVLKPACKATIIAPHWCSNRAYGDYTHKWPAISEMSFWYLNREWRLGNEEKKIPANAPHTDVKWDARGYACDFDATYGGSLHPALLSRNDEFRQFAFSFYKEAFQDICATLTKR